MTARKTIFLDMDGVLVNLCGPILGLFGVPESYVCDIDSWDAMPRVVSNNIGRHVTDEELWGRVADRGAAFWAGLHWTPWGAKILRHCIATGSRIVILTKPKDGASYAGKMAWLDRELPAYQRATAEDKSALAMGPQTLLVDDAEHNIDAFHAAGGGVVLVPRPWNRARSHSGMVARTTGERIEQWDRWTEDLRGL